MIMEEELVDEILLLFTLAANHPAMSFSQRRNLHQRLVDLRETIEKSFKCYQATDVCSQHNQEYICKPLEKSSTQKLTNSNDQRPMADISKTELNMQPAASAENTEVPASKITSDVHIKDLRVVRVQQRPFDKKYEYIFEVTWSNGKAVRIHRAYGELFDFQCKLRRRYSKEISKMTERKVIPYLPARRPIKFCKGNQILPDITHYVREFTKLPDKLLHSESVENFFSDGTTEKISDEKQQTSKSKQNSNHEKNDHAHATCKQADVSRGNHVDVKSDKGTGSIKNHSPKGKWSTSFCGRKFNNSLQTSKKRPLLSPKNCTNDTPLSPKEVNKAKVVHLQPKAILKSPNSSSAQPSAVAVGKTQTVEEGSKTKTVDEESKSKTVDGKGKTQTVDEESKTKTVDETQTVVNEETKTDHSLLNGDALCCDNTEKSISERTTTENTHLKTNNDDSSIQNAIESDSSPKIDLNATQRTDSPTPNASTGREILSLTSLCTSSMTSSVVISPISTASSSPSLTNVTSSISTSSTITSNSVLPSNSLTQTSSLSSEMTPSVTPSSMAVRTITSSTEMSSAMTPPGGISSEASTAISGSPVSILTSSASTRLALTSSPVMSSNSAALSLMTPSATTITSVTVMSSVSSSVTSSTIFAITSPTSSMTSFTSSLMTSPVMTSFSRPSALTVKSPHVPLTVAVPVLSPPCGTCLISNQSSSDGSLTSSLSRSPLCSPVFPRPSFSEFSFDKRTLNGSTGICLSPGKCRSPASKLCQCEEFEQDFVDDEILDPCDSPVETMKMENTVVNNLKSTPILGKNGYTRSHHNTPQHGLLILPNGYNELHADPRLHCNNYDYHAPERNHEEVLYHDDFTTHKTNDQNCNFIFQNGGHDPTLDFNSNKSYEYKYTAYLNKKSNGVSKPFCYNCGKYGHQGGQCSGTEIEESIVS